MTTVTTQLR